MRYQTLHRFRLPTSLAVACILFFPEARSALAPIHTVKPEYPKGLITEGIEGTTVITATVTADGNIAECAVKSADHELFGESAIAALKQWRFTPHEVDGKPVKKKVNIPFNFHLPDWRKAELKIERINNQLGREIYKELDPDIEIFQMRKLPAKLRPHPVRFMPPAYPDELKGTGKTGKVIYKFYVDIDGRTINLELLECDEPAFETPAFLSIVFSEFMPVNRKGSPIYVEMHRQFDFSEDMGNQPHPGQGRRGRR